MITIRFVRIPSWAKNRTDLLSPLVDTALDRISGEIETRHNRAKGLGVERNVIEVREVMQARQVLTSLEWPRTTGAAMQRKNIGLFRGMAPRVIKKYIVEPLQKKWAA